MAAIPILLFFLLFALIFVMALVPLAMHIWALVDIAQTPDAAFGPPWDNTKNTWMLGLCVAFIVPVGHIIAPILWWTQIRGPRLRGEPIPRPFWSSAPVAPPNGPPPAAPPPGQASF